MRQRKKTQRLKLKTNSFLANANERKGTHQTKWKKRKIELWRVSQIAILAISLRGGAKEISLTVNKVGLQ